MARCHRVRRPLTAGASCPVVRFGAALAFHGACYRIPRSPQRGPCSCRLHTAVLARVVCVCVRTPLAPARMVRTAPPPPSPPPPSPTRLHGTPTHCSLPRPFPAAAKQEREHRLQGGVPGDMPGAGAGGSGGGMPRAGGAAAHGGPPMPRATRNLWRADDDSPSEPPSASDRLEGLFVDVGEVSGSRAGGVLDAVLRMHGADGVSVEGVEDVVRQWPPGIPLPRALEALYSQHVAATAGSGGSGAAGGGLLTSPYAVLALSGASGSEDDPDQGSPGDPDSSDAPPQHRQRAGRPLSQGRGGSGGQRRGHRPHSGHQDPDRGAHSGRGVGVSESPVAAAVRVRVP
jgi:hypothetical protein